MKQTTMRTKATRIIAPSNSLRPTVRRDASKAPGADLKYEKDVEYVAKRHILIQP